MIPYISILGVKVHKLTSEQLISILLDRLEQGLKTSIATINTEFIIEAQHNDAFKQQLTNSDIATADGVGILWAAKLNDYAPKLRIASLQAFEIVFVAIFYGVTTIFSRSARYRVIPEQITGVDLSFKLASFASDRNLRLFLLGADSGVAEEAARKLEQLFPGLNIAGTYAGNGSSAGDHVTREIVSQHPSEIILVAYGAPKQEMWIQRNFSSIPPLVAIGVGGTFMFLSGRTKRAPLLFRRFGVEWLYRLITQPWRWRRQLALPKFIYLVIKAKSSHVG